MRFHKNSTVGRCLRRQMGMTMFECLVAIAILAISVSIAVPSYRFLKQRHQSMLVRQQLTRAIRYARSQAIHYQHMTTLQGAPTWQTAYQVSIEHKRLQVFSSLIRQGDLSWKGFPNYDYLQFTPQGFTNQQNGTFSFSVNGQLVWQLIVNKAGRVRVVMG